MNQIFRPNQMEIAATSLSREDPAISETKFRWVAGWRTSVEPPKTDFLEFKSRSFQDETIRQWVTPACAGRSIYIVRRAIWLCLLLICISIPMRSTALQGGQTSPESHDGSHDFDFDLGVWKTDIVRRVHPLSGSNETVHLIGKVTVRKLWNGRAQVEEIVADGPKGRWEGMTVFLYDPQARQWSMNFANSSVGKITPPMIGAFQNGRCVLIGTDIVDGRAVLVRAVWSDFTPTTHTYQESYSADGGQTWEVYFTGHKTKLQ